jgi:hypothetical protein
VYAKRDIYPLLTFTESPQDRLTPFMWVKLAVSSVPTSDAGWQSARRRADELPLRR